jgi:hypothetical protein
VIGVAVMRDGPERHVKPARWKTPAMPDLLGELLEPEDEDRISAVFRHFEDLTTLATGRTVGRKIGVAQEVLLKKYLQGNDPLKRRMYLERQLDGASGASHKVEFSWYAMKTHSLEAGDPIPGTPDLRLVAVDDATEQVRIAGDWSGQPLRLKLGPAAKRPVRLREALSGTGIDIRLAAVDGSSAEIDVVDLSQLLASLESKRVGAQRFSNSDKLGSGIQTIEKAKQASLVAIDLDLHHNGTVKPLADSGAERRLLSFVALGNGVHWTTKDRAVLGTYVDFVFLVKDEAIIRYARWVAEQADEEYDALAAFMDYFVGMTRQPEDEFAVSDEDFEIVEPASEGRTLIQILAEHVQAVDS